MCGITGILSFDTSTPVSSERMERAVAALQQRGPDGSGIFIRPQLGLGHTRLSIIDTSTAAAQPFTTNDDRYTLVFNGEIFNYRELRKTLEQNGTSFRSQSDSEVLLHWIIQHGENCLHHLNGFFAFALWDDVEKTLFIARDRYGEKPFYYFRTSSEFLFASEPKALFALGIPRKINANALNAYLHLNYVPDSLCMIDGMEKLQAGSWMKWDATTGKNTSARWHTLPVTDASNDKRDYESLKKELHARLEKAVQDRLIADVPLGAFLSGGVDSSVVAALAARHTDKLHTFSIGYADEPYFDETNYARLAAKHLGTEHTVFSLRNRDLYEQLTTVLDYLDEPFADSSALAVGALSRLVKPHITVALSGDGADELFAGYHKHRAEWLAQRGGWKNTLVKNTGFLWNNLPASRNSTLGNRVRQLRKFSEGLNLNATDRYYRWAGFLAKGEVNDLVLETYQQQTPVFPSEIQTISTSDFNTVLANDVRLVLPGDMLVKVDRMSMSEGLEVRPPFLDVNVADWAMQLPAKYKLDASDQKKIVKDSFRNLLPAEIFDRRKQGFEVPLLGWFRGDLRGMIDELLDEELIREQGIFKVEGIVRLRAQLHSSSPGDAVARVWGLIVFQYWWKKYLSS